VIYDDDGSPDGTGALMYLLSHPDVDLKAIMITYGEAYPEPYIQHIARKLDSFGITGIPYGPGQSAPLEGNNVFPESMRESANNFWGWPIPNQDKTYPATPAADLYISILNQASEPVNIFISGPCTNLAQALRLDPGIREHIAGIYIMGGAVYVPGNISDLVANSGNTTAEWNIYGDPVAAGEVFASGLDVYIVPLDATNQVTATRDDTNAWRTGGGPANFAADIFESLMANWNTGNVSIWDLMTAAIMLNPELCGTQTLPLEVDMDFGKTSGQTRVVDGGQPNVEVCLEPDVDAIHQTMTEVFSGAALPTASSIEPTAAATVQQPQPAEIPVTATPENLVFFDGFDGALQPGWSWENEKPDEYAFTQDGWLNITGEDASLLYGQGQINLLWYELPEGDFAITVHLRADPDANFQQAAIFLYEDLENYVAINRGYCSVCSTGGNGIFMEYKIGGGWDAYEIAFDATDLYLKLESKQNTISGYYAEAPGEWQRLGRFGNYFTFKHVGLGVSNCDRAGVDGDLVGSFDYFEISRP
jgi:pyrimidine-specific ribonucleoside hydrolase